MDAFPSSETPDLQAAPRGSDTTLSHSRCGHHSGRGCLDDPAARDADSKTATVTVSGENDMLPIVVLAGYAVKCAQQGMG